MPDPDLPAQGTEPPAAPAAQRSPVERVIVAAAAGTTVDPSERIDPLARSSYAIATNRGYGNAMGRGLELALTLAVMTGIGWLLDRAAGTAPLFIIVFSVIGFAGITVKLWLGYDLEMRKHEDGAIWNRGKGSNGTETMAS